MRYINVLLDEFVVVPDYVDENVMIENNKSVRVQDFEPLQMRGN